MMSAMNHMTVCMWNAVNTCREFIVLISKENFPEALVYHAANGSL